MAFFPWVPPHHHHHTHQECLPVTFDCCLIVQLIEAQVAFDLGLLRERIGKLSGPTGLDRLNAALREVRLRALEDVQLQLVDRFQLSSADPNVNQV
jgi:hypothetical protein